MFGCSVRFYTDPQAALKEAQQRAPDIAFLDLGMPVLNGYRLASMLRAQFSHEKLTLVAVSGYDTPADRANSRHSGFDAHVNKPVDVDMVRSILEHLTYQRFTLRPQATAPEPSVPETP
jgi:CheY-like chemotaxis protein